MYDVAILEPQNGQIANFIRDYARGCTRPEGLFISKSEHIGDSCPTELDLLILSSASVSEPLRDVSCRFLMVPGSMPPKNLDGISAACVVTYGMSGRDSVTLSSLSRGGCVLSLQRELVTLDGSVLERQELPVQLRGSISEYDFMAAAGALLLMNLSPSRLLSGAMK